MSIFSYIKLVFLFCLAFVLFACAAKKQQIGVLPPNMKIEGEEVSKNTYYPLKQYGTVSGSDSSTGQEVKEGSVDARMAKEEMVKNETLLNKLGSKKHNNGSPVPDSRRRYYKGPYKNHY